MPLLTLPNEIIFDVSKCFENLKDLNNLLQCNRYLYMLLNDTLYHQALQPLEGRTALQWAARNGHEYLTKYLLSKGVDTEATIEGLYGMHYDRPLLAAAVEGHLGVLRILLEHGADIHARHDGLISVNTTILHSTVVACNLEEDTRGEVMRILLDAGADKNAQDEDGNTALHKAVVGEIDECEMESKVAVEVLFEYGVDPSVKNRYGMTALHTALMTARWMLDPDPERRIIKFLLEKGAEVNIKNGGGRTPLHIAAEFELVDVVEILIKHGADVNALDSEDMNPLMYLLNYWARVPPFKALDDLDRLGWLIRLLLDSGTDRNQQDINGRRAVDIAKEVRNPELLKQFTAHINLLEVE